jgi:hypothetical protein
VSAPAPWSPPLPAVLATALTTGCCRVPPKPHPIRPLQCPETLGAAL